MCLMSVMTWMEFSRAEYSADHSALFRRNITSLRYLCSRLIRVDLRVRETTAMGVYHAGSLGHGYNYERSGTVYLSIIK
jgi:hypothetical protein